MMKASKILSFCILLWASASCEKTEPVLLSGNIDGLVTLYDENSGPPEDASGVQVTLAADSIVAQTFTDPSGKFLLEDISYGNYQINLLLNGYITASKAFTLHHLGGYSPTMVEYSLYEIPKFETRIDSIQFNGTYERSYVYVTLKGLSGVPRIGYLFWCFFNNTPEVSNNQFVAKNRGWIWSPEIDGLLTEISVEIWDNRFDQLKSDTIYLCVYPQAWGQEYYDSYPESLGKPSNVISFMAW